MCPSLQPLDLPARSSGSLATPPGPATYRSQGALTADQLIVPNTIEPTHHVTASVGSLIVMRGREQVATVSSHTILDPLRLLDFPKEEELESVTQQPDPAVRPLSEVLEEIEALTGLPKARLAADLFDVSRTAYHDWGTGKRVSIENERRIRGTLDVLQRASARHGDPELIRGWLVTPVGSRAVAPIELLKTGKIDEARLFAISTLPERETALPEWLLAGPINNWSEREQKRRSFVVRESDAIARVTDDD